MTRLARLAAPVVAVRGVVVGMKLITDLAVIRPAAYGLGGDIEGYLLYWEQWTYKMVYQALDSWTIYKTVDRARAVALKKNPDARVTEG